MHAEDSEDVLPNCTESGYAWFKWDLQQNRIPPCLDQCAMKRSYRDAELGSPTANGSGFLDGDALIKGKSHACS
jgi:hypothetical protein